MLLTAVPWANQRLQLRVMLDAQKAGFRKHRYLEFLVTNEMDIQSTIDLRTSELTQKSAWSGRLWVYYYAILFFGGPVWFLVFRNSISELFTVGLPFVLLLLPPVVWLFNRQRLAKLRRKQLSEVRKAKQSS